MIYLFAVAAPPRSGTMWFSRVLTTEHSFCYHELVTHLHPYPTNLVLGQWFQEQVTDSSYELAQRRAILQCYPDYFARHWERAIYGQYIVGNSDSYLVRYLPGLWLLWPDMRFIFSTRNGINCVQSHYVKQPEVPAIVRLLLQERYDTATDPFAACCHRWVTAIRGHTKSKTWLVEHGANCIETKFEKVTSDLNELHRLWDWLGIDKWDEHAERNARFMETPINPRMNIKKIVQPEETWRAWSPEQRKTFREICGETMAQLGYPLPH